MARRKSNSLSPAFHSRVQPSKEWLLRMAEAEDRCGCISVGGLAVDVGLYRSEPEPQPSGPSDRELLREARVILRTLVNADAFPAMFQAKVWAEEFLALHGDGDGAPVGVISNGKETR